MPRTATIQLNLYADTMGSGLGARLSTEQLERARKRLEELFKPPSGPPSSSFLCSFEVGNSVPDVTTSHNRSDGLLLQDLNRLGPVAAPAGQWTARVLIAQSSDRSSGPLGALFDLEGRRGCAVFLFSIAGAAMGFEKLLVRTIAHEVGHVFNLAHEDASVKADVLYHPLSAASVNTPELSGNWWQHLLHHDADSVRPGGLRFTQRACTGHPTGSFAGAGPTESSVIGARLHIEVSPGRVYPNVKRPTFVIGEPLHLRLVIRNDSRRTVRLAQAPSTATQDLVVYRVDRAGTATQLAPPVRFCSAAGRREWLRLTPGSVAVFHETLVSRNGEPVFPVEGAFTLTAALRCGSGWLRSQPVEVAVAPPLERRHERSSRLAADPEIGVFLEAGSPHGSQRVLERLRRLARSNPKFPLNDLVDLLVGREAVLAEGKTPAASRQLLQRLAVGHGIPRPLQLEADLLLQLDAWQRGDQKARAKLRRRLSQKARLPVGCHTAYLIKRCLGLDD